MPGDDDVGRLTRAFPIGFRNNDGRPAGNWILLPHQVGPAAQIVGIGAAEIVGQIPGDDPITRGAESGACQLIGPRRRTEEPERVPARFVSLFGVWQRRELDRVEAPLGQELQRLALPLDHARQERVAVDQ